MSSGMRWRAKRPGEESAMTAKRRRQRGRADEADPFVTRRLWRLHMVTFFPSKTCSDEGQVSTTSNKFSQAAAAMKMSRQ